MKESAAEAPIVVDHGADAPMVVDHGAQAPIVAGNPAHHAPHVVDGASDRSPSTEEKEIGVEKSHFDLPPDPDGHLSAEERAAIDRKLLWKLDIKLIPWLCLLYLISFLDRTNIVRLESLQQLLAFD